MTASSSLTSRDIRQTLAEADCLFDHQQVDQALDRMAERINHRLQDTQTLCLCVMTGGIVPTGQLLPRLTVPLELDYIHATRYDSGTQGGKLKWLHQPRTSLEGRTLLIIDDILDEGLTLQGVVDECLAQGATTVLTAVLTEKQLPERKGLANADFVGLRVPDRYLFGYGMDYREQLRHAAGIYAVKDL